MKIKELKQELKNQVLHIKECRKRYRAAKTPEELNAYWAWRRECGIYTDSRTYRHGHIAYCLLRGRTYEQIENKVHEGNKPSWSQIELIMEKYREIEEVVNV